MNGKFPDRQWEILEWRFVAKGPFHKITEFIGQSIAFEEERTEEQKSLRHYRNFLLVSFFLDVFGECRRIQDIFQSVEETPKTKGNRNTKKTMKNIEMCLLKCTNKG